MAEASALLAKASLPRGVAETNPAGLSIVSNQVSLSKNLVVKILTHPCTWSRPMSFHVDAFLIAVQAEASKNNYHFLVLSA